MLAGLPINDQDLIIRRMRDEFADYAAMAKWLSDVRVLEFYEGRDRPLTLDQVKGKYSPRIFGQDGVTPCLLLFQGASIGSRVRCLDPQADLELLEGIEGELRETLRESGPERQTIVRKIQESFSNALQVSDLTACLAESPTGGS